ncbi:MAG: hypothetical protein ACM31C_17040, partial [Acidobacteriota bacterium]
TVVMRPEAIEADRDVPPPGRVEFGFDGGAPVGTWALGAQLGYLDRPLVLRDADLTVYPVRHRETLALGGALAIGPDVVVDARVPLAHQVGERLQHLGDDSPLDRWVIGDITVGARLRVAGDDARAVFLRGQLYLPTGDDFQFAGDARWSGSWLLIGRTTLAPGVVAAATGGIRIRAAEVQVGDRLVGDELAYGAGLAVALPPVAHLWCVPDQLRATGELVGVVGDRVGGQRGPSPVEARVGVVGQPRPDLSIGVRAGVGLDDQVGSPRFRAMLEVAWHGPPPERRAKPVTLDDDELEGD